MRLRQLDTLVDNRFGSCNLINVWVHRASIHRLVTLLVRQIRFDNLRTENKNDPCNQNETHIRFDLGLKDFVKDGRTGCFL